MFFMLKESNQVHILLSLTVCLNFHRHQTAPTMVPKGIKELKRKGPRIVHHIPGIYHR